MEKGDNMCKTVSPTVTCGTCGKECEGLISVIVNERLQYVCDECARANQRILVRGES